MNGSSTEIKRDIAIVKKDIPERKGSLLGIIKISRRYLTLQYHSSAVAAPFETRISVFWRETGTHHRQHPGHYLVYEVSKQNSGVKLKSYSGIFRPEFKINLRHRQMKRFG